MRRLTVLAVALCLTAFMPVWAQAQTTPAASAPAPDGRFVVFFQEWSAALDAPAQAVIATAAKAALADPKASVLVSGTADPIGSARANELVSALRAQMVTDALIAAGVPAERISQRALGATEYALNALESRRASIAISAK